MVTLVSDVHIPFEIIGLIISNLYNQKHLINVCLVSRAWYKLGLPRLWREVHLGKPGSVEQFVARLESNDELPIFRVGPCVRILSVHPVSEYFLEDEDEAVIARFQKVVPKLTSLEHLSWKAYIGTEVDIIQALRQSCSTLRSVDITQLTAWRPAGTLNILLC